MRWWVLVLALAACDDDPAAGRPSDPNPGGGGASANDLSVLPDGKAPAAPPDLMPPNPSVYGTVAFTVSDYTSGTTRTLGTTGVASFQRLMAGSGGGGGTPCTTSMNGACSLTLCPQTVPDMAYVDMATVHDLATAPHDLATAARDLATPDLATPVYHENVGTITVTVGGAAVTMPPLTDGTYDVYQPKTALWSTSQTMTVTAPGHELPAFTASLQTPEKLRVAMSPPATGNKLLVTRNADLPLTWTGSVGNVSFTFVSSAPSLVGILSCTYPAAQDQATIPKALLGQLPVGSGAVSGSAVATTNVRVGEMQVFVYAAAPAVYSDDSYFGSAADFN
jgi:hypothetical protein